MKHAICILLALAVTVGIGASCRKRDMRTIVIQVPGMKNEACSRIVKDALLRTPGVLQESVSTDVAAHTVTATYDSIFLAKKNIEFAVAEAGFAANDIPAKAEAAAKLPPECR